MNYNEIENKYKDLIKKSKEYMMTIKDSEHNVMHVIDVVNYVKELLDNIDDNQINKDVCIISAYWHDIGRTVKVDGHEKISAEMLKEEMMKYHYDESLINECYKAIEKHKWNMQPTTKEGLLLKDADKLAWLGIGRWRECLKNHQNLDSIINLLPKLRNEILHYDYSKKIYDRDIVEIVKLIYEKI